MRCAFVLLLTACVSTAPPPPVDALASIHHVIDDWHHAASIADENAYFGYAAPEFSVTVALPRSRRGTGRG